jgi:hypothetical protein
LYIELLHQIQDPIKIRNPIFPFSKSVALHHFFNRNV